MCKTLLQEYFEIVDSLISTPLRLGFLSVAYHVSYKIDERAYNEADLHRKLC